MACANRGASLLLDIDMLALDVVVGVSSVPCPLAISILILEPFSVGRTFTVVRGSWEDLVRQGPSSPC